MSRRTFIATSLTAAALAALPRRLYAQATGPFSLPPLGYGYEALEPNIDAQTMTIHHQRHHGAYVSNVNSAAASWAELKPENTESILRNINEAPESLRTAIRNNLGGHWNHAHFWTLMTPGGAKEPTGALKTAIDSTFGDFGKLKERVNAAGTGRFGSGWAWLVVGKDGKLAVTSSPNQDNPLMDGAKGVVLGVDVWEHAYYLKYQNKRADYLTAWWNTVNWDKAGANFAKATG
jgi:Fe-Mn family superoxide dismutase